MRVFVKINHKRLPSNHNFFLAYKGFEEMGFEIEFFNDNLNPISKNDIVIGDVATSRLVLEKFDVKIEEFNYPSELMFCCKRKIWKSTINKIAMNPEAWPVFVKPVEDKLFAGRLVSSTKDLIGCGNENENENADIEIYCSEAVNFVSEYRCFVRYGKILDIRRYKGSYRSIPSYFLIERAVKNFKNAPNGYAIDFGVTDRGETLLIEVNDGYALGSYGLFYVDYAKLLSARWCQLMGTEDKCNF